jgi:hypothetical protein
MTQLTRSTSKLVKAGLKEVPKEVPNKDALKRMPLRKSLKGFDSTFTMDYEYHYQKLVHSCVLNDI